PDFHRRDLADAIEAGAYPEWELGVQTFPDTDDQMFEGIDLLDPTKFVPEELAPVQPIGVMTLNANPTNFFAETEQVAFHPGHLVPGIDVTNDPLLQVRLFSYLDTQISRLGGPNFGQIPINRPQAPVNDMLRDGMHQQAVHGGVAPYHPNSLDGGCPFLAGQDVGAFIDVPEELVASIKERKNPASFDDHYSQVGLFFRSLSPVEQDHVIQAYTFELGKCYEKSIRERQLAALANVDAGLCAAVAKGLGLPVPAATEQVTASDPSPALSQVGKTWPVAGRVVGILADQDSDLAAVNKVRKALDAEGIVPLIIAPSGGFLGEEDNGGVPVQRTYLTARSTEFDAVIVSAAAAPAPDAAPGLDAKSGAPAGASDPRAVLLLTEAFRHAKAIGSLHAGSAALTAAGIPQDAPGIVSEEDAEALVTALTGLLAAHRVWERFPAAPA
ncbi:catalase, partial [Pseudarthrobacter sulfonivorans]|uniref:catalase n=1 Tax=Pseudarthrobacter sulfonivorans TaxID=121292 RepID=UPI00278697C2